MKAIVALTDVVVSLKFELNESIIKQLIRHLFRIFALNQNVVVQ